ncbi:MAG: SGNH/GDSL hydrolase family protein [Chloroherpetonaceae bacterium]|nr:SGNH/GDSL hydrolase family protein [Chthonomonadaceae bacterium]MDW8207185.1 SGNH/GDSL hydrolase family protein [Chloroherpetonaceae bacterium]
MRFLYLPVVSVTCVLFMITGSSGALLALEKPVPLRPLQGVRRVLFLGDSITYAGGYVEWIDACLFRYAPEQRYELINLGLPSETVSGLSEPGHAGGAFPRPDLHERLERALTRLHPDMVVACYGMNDGIYHPWDAGRFARYRAGMQRLQETVRRAGATLWVVTPPPFDAHPVRARALPAGQSGYSSDRPFEGYDAVLARYAAWLRGKRRAGWKVIDVHASLRAVLTARRQQDPDFVLAGDGVHLEAYGHRLVAREILRAWGASSMALLELERATLLPADGMALVRERQQILRDAYLSAVGHRRPGLPAGMPVAEAEAKARQLEERIREMVRTR